VIRLNGEIAAIVAAAGAAIIVPISMLRSNDPPQEHILRLAATQVPPPAELALRGTALEAPLFNPDRTPSPPPGQDAATDQPTAAPPASPPLLVGTIAGRGSAGVALVKNSAGETLTLRVGEVVDGWTLIAIGNGAATVDQNGRRETISLNFSNKDAGQQAANAQSPIPLAPAATAVTTQTSAQNGSATTALAGTIGH